MKKPKTQINPYTGKLCIATKIKCNCACHSSIPGDTIMHFQACCDHGYITVYKDIPNQP